MEPSEKKLSVSLLFLEKDRSLLIVTYFVHFLFYMPFLIIDNHLIAHMATLSFR